jgi:hypothetical protein
VFTALKAGQIIPLKTAIATWQKSLIFAAFRTESRLCPYQKEWMFYYYKKRKNHVSDRPK